MILSGKEVAKFLENIKESQIQPSGVDLTVEKILALDGKGELLKENVILPRYKELPTNDNKWYLRPGIYIVTYEQIIRIPSEAAGIVLPRSSLMRMGAIIYTALWDPGYEGKGASLLQVVNPNGVVIEKGARISQLILFRSEAKEKYSGRYQGEGLNFR